MLRLWPNKLGRDDRIVQAYPGFCVSIPLGIAALPEGLGTAVNNEQGSSSRNRDVGLLSQNGDQHVKSNTRALDCL